MDRLVIYPNRTQLITTTIFAFVIVVVITGFFSLLLKGNVPTVGIVAACLLFIVPFVAALLGGIVLVIRILRNKPLLVADARGIHISRFDGGTVVNWPNISKISISMTKSRRLGIRGGVHQADVPWKISQITHQRQVL